MQTGGTYTGVGTPQATSCGSSALMTTPGLRATSPKACGERTQLLFMLPCVVAFGQVRCGPLVDSRTC